MAQFIRISKREARKIFAEGNKFIFVCPCKMWPSAPWNMAAMISGREYLENAERYAPREDGTDAGSCWKGNLADTAWDLMYNNWAFYNATHETGYYAHYYIQIDERRERQVKRFREMWPERNKYSIYRGQLKLLIQGMRTR